MDEMTLARHWWAVVLRGALSILFGVLASLWPGAFWLAAVVTFTVYSLVYGILAIAGAVTGGSRAGPWWALLLQGVVSLASAAIAILWPGITELALFYLIAGWCIATGVFEIAASVQLRREMQGTGLMALSGVLSILLGLSLGLFPLVGLVVLALWVAGWAIAYGVLLVVLGFRLRSLARHTPASEPVAVHDRGLSASPGRPGR